MHDIQLRERATRVVFAEQRMHTRESAAADAGILLPLVLGEVVKLDIVARGYHRAYI